MDLHEIEIFYKGDKEEYVLKKDSELIKWLDSKIKDGYKPFISINELQHLIDTIFTWYEIKYPNKDYENIEGIKDYTFSNIVPLSSYMSFEQLMYRLPYNELFLMRCCYRSKVLSELPIFESGKVISYDKLIHFSITNDVKAKSERDYDFYADFVTGSIKKVYSLSEKYNYLLESRINDLNDKFDIYDLKEFFSNEPNIDMHELDEIINTHKIDCELRDKVINLVSLKLLYNKSTSVRRGYDRAVRLINEYNQNFGRNNSIDFLETIIHKDYSADIKKRR